MSKIPKEKQSVIDWVEKNKSEISELDDMVWEYAETALREFKSAKAHCDFLTKHGFKVEEGIAGMPTAFLGTWGKGKPVLGTFAEYDATPDRSQKAVPYEAPIVPHGPGFTDAHHTLGAGATAGIVAAKYAMEQNGLKGTLKIFGTPAEKVCIGKPWQAAKGYYDGFDAFVTWHPGDSSNVVWETHAGSYWAAVVTFECTAPEKWIGLGRHPGAVQAADMMFSLTQKMKEFMLPNTHLWLMNEWFMIGGQASADYLPPRIAQIQYAWRCSNLDENEAILRVLENNAEAIGIATKTNVSWRWVAKCRPGLPNLEIAKLVQKNLELVGPIRFTEEEKEFAREIMRNLGYEPHQEPFKEEVVDPVERERRTREVLPPEQLNWGSDDYVEFTWHAPCARFHVGVTTALKPPKERPKALGQARRAYPSWVYGALCGTSLTNKSAWGAAKVTGLSLIDLIIKPEELKKAQDEFKERTGGGVGGSKWIAPLLPKDQDPPVNMNWPEWVNRPGSEWWITY